MVVGVLEGRGGAMLAALVPEEASLENAAGQIASPPLAITSMIND
jgi:hypothetical protein